MQICKKKGARRLQKDLNINWEEKYQICFVLNII
jgi:hypothetical protein